MIDSLDFIDDSLSNYFEGILEFFHGSFQNTFLKILSIFVRLIILINLNTFLINTTSPTPLKKFQGQHVDGLSLIFGVLTLFTNN